MDIGYLGDLVVIDGDHAVDLKGRRLRALLTRLAIDAGRPVSARALMESVWDDGETPSDPVNALQSLVSRLRKALGDASLIEQVPVGYRLTLDPEHVDGGRFTRLAAAGHRALAAGDLDDARQALDDALILWRGEPLAEESTPEAATVRAALEDQHVTALIARAEVELRSGHAEEALARAEPLAAALPMREDVAALRLRALVGAGRPAEALVAFERVRAHLRDTLGSDPSPELRDLHLQILELSDAPAPRRAIPTNVRAALTSFLGREDDVAEVRGRLGAYRLVTVVGAGGSGKTRLATEVARTAVAESRPAVRDGVWFVELAPITEPGNVALAMIDGLELRDVTVLDTRLDRVRAEARERVVEALAPADCLIVIDNCEHLIDAVADLVADILARCPGVRILATSREPLAVDGEALHALSPLPLPSATADPELAEANVAVRLLLDRAWATGAELRLDADSVGAVCDIVRRLDGLPLAIELAAARLRVMSVHEVSARLDDRFRLLTGGRRTALPRHRTLRAVVEWSWGLLGDEERQVADYFCLFVAGADAAAVAHVCPRFKALWQADPKAAADAATDVLLALVDKSILVARSGNGGTRFRMLETLREFGADRLSEQGLAAEAGMAHARHYAEVAARADTRLRTRDQVDGLTVLDTERENIFAAMTFLGDAGEVEDAVRLAVALGWFWTLRDNERDAVRWFGYVLGLPGSKEASLAPVAEGWLLISTLAGLAGTQTGAAKKPSPESTIGRLEAMLPAYPAARLLLCLLLYFSGQRERGVATLREAVDDETDPWLQAAARTVVITLMENEGDIAGMHAELDVTSEQWRVLGDAWGISISLSTRGQLRILEGDLPGAVRDLEQARETLRRLGNSSDELLLTTRLLEVQVRLGDLERANALADSLERWRVTAGREQLRDILVETSRSSIALARGDLDGIRTARARLRTMLERGAAPNDFEAHAHAVGCAYLALLGCALADLVQARRDVGLAYRLGVRTEDLPIIANVAVAVAALAVAEGSYAEVASILGAAARLRGSDDPTHPLIIELTAGARAKLGEDAFEREYRSALTLPRDDALARVDPERIRPTP